MWHYGRKIIDALFEKRTERTPVCAELESRNEADSSRSDIRVFETGLSTERYGDNEQGSRNAAQEAESNRLISIARTNGLFIPRSEWEHFGDRKCVPSGESIVYYNESRQSVGNLQKQLTIFIDEDIRRTGREC